MAGGAADEELLVVDGVDVDLAEVGGALVLVAEEGPGFAAVVGAEDAGAVGVGGRGRAASLATARATAGGTGSCTGFRGSGCRFTGGRRGFGCRAATGSGRRGTAFGSGAAACSSAGSGFHLGKDGGRTGREDADGDATVDAVFRFGPAVAVEFGPGGAAVDGFPERAAGASAVIAPPGAAALEAGCVDDLGVRRVYGDIVEAGVGIDVFGLVPRFAAIDGFEEAAFGVLPEEMAHDGGEYDLGVGGIDGDAVDGLGVFEAEVCPGFAAVDGAPHAVADRRALAVVGFAFANVDDVGVGRGDGDGADGLVGLVIELGFPVVTAIGGFPQSAGGETDVEEHGVFGGTLYIVEAAGHGGGADGAEFETFEARVGWLVDHRGAGDGGNRRWGGCGGGGGLRKRGCGDRQG